MSDFIRWCSESSTAMKLGIGGVCAGLLYASASTNLVTLVAMAAIPWLPDTLSSCLRKASPPSEKLDHVLGQTLAIQAPAADAFPPNQASLIATVKSTAALDSRQTVKDIQSLGIQDPVALIEIAKICAAQNGWYTAQYIRNFGIEDPVALIEIAKICAAQNGWKTAQFIQRFNIHDQVALIEIAKICAAQNGYGTALHFRQFGIQNEAVSIEIAKICAAQHGFGTALQFRQFGIQNEAASIEIAKICATENGYDTARLIENFGIQNQPFVMEIIEACVYQDNRALAFLYKVDCKLAEAILARYINRSLENCGFEWLLNYFSAIRDPHVRKEVIISVTDAFFLLRQKLTAKQMMDLNQRGLIHSIYALRSPHLYLPLVRHLSEYCGHEGFLQQFDGIKPLKLEQYPSLKLLRVILANLKEQGVNIAPTIELLDVKQYKVFKDISKAKLLLMVLLNLANTSSLTPNQKGAVLIKLDSYKAANSMSIIFDLNAEALLQDDLKSLAEVSEQAIHTYLPLQGVDNATARFSETFGASRYPQGFWQYAAKMKTLDDPSVLDCLGEYASSVFNNTFSNERYNRNPHLAKLEEAVPGIVNDWRQSISAAASQPDQSIAAFDPFNWMHTKLIADGHMRDLSRFADLKYYLEASHVEQREKIAAEIDSLDETNSENAFQKACLRLIKAQSLNAQRQALSRLSEALQKLCPDSEFNNDVNGLLETLSIKTQEKDLRVIETDDPYHLLYCGTDVASSCQRIDGDPELNKGLLGYLMNGQTRLVAVVNQSNRILARALLRLLWDGEKPVLFLERQYGDETFKESILRLAKAKAQKMGLVLTIQAEQGESYTKPLHSLGGRAPFEYCDGAMGVQKGGVFMIENAKIS